MLLTKDPVIPACLCDFSVSDVLYTLHEIWHEDGTGCEATYHVNNLLGYIRKLDKNCPHIPVWLSNESDSEQDGDQEPEEIKGREGQGKSDGS